MKKLFVLLLALAMTLTLFASCSSCDKEEEKGKDGASTTTADDDPSKETEPSEKGFTSVNKTMYVNTTTLNVREEPDANDNDNIIGKVTLGTALEVTGENEETDWARIKYNNQTAYVKSTYLSATKPDVPEDPSTAEVIADDKFTAVNETVYIFATNYDSATNKDVHQHNIEKINAYSRPYASDWDGKSDSWLANHTEITRVGVYYEKENDPSYGWSKLSFVEKEGDAPTIVYVRNSQIAMELPESCTPSAPADTSPSTNTQ